MYLYHSIWYICNNVYTVLPDTRVGEETARIRRRMPLLLVCSSGKATGSMLLWRDGAAGARYNIGVHTRIIGAQAGSENSHCTTFQSSYRLQRSADRPAGGLPSTVDQGISSRTHGRACLWGKHLSSIWPMKKPNVWREPVGFSHFSLSTCEWFETYTTMMNTSFKLPNIIKPFAYSCISEQIDKYYFDLFYKTINNT